MEVSVRRQCNKFFNHNDSSSITTNTTATTRNQRNTFQQRSTTSVMLLKEFQKEHNNCSIAGRNNKNIAINSIKDNNLMHETNTLQCNNTVAVATHFTRTELPFYSFAMRAALTRTTATATAAAAAAATTTTRTTTTTAMSTSTKSYKKSAKLSVAQRCWPQRHLLSTVLTFCTLALVLSLMPAPSSALDMGNELNLKPTKYTNWSKNVTYLSSTKYNALGMQPLYNITHKIMWFFVGEDALPEGYITIQDMHVRPGPKVERNEWGDLLKHYWGILLVVVLTGLLVILMPIIGLCFCCCRCAGACGGRSQPFDKKHDTCRRVFLGLLLIILTTGILFGVIVAFATNSYMQFGVDDATNAVSRGASDTRLFLSVTSEHVDHVLVNNYNQLSNQLDDILRETSTFIITQLEQKSMAVSLKYLTNFLAKLPEMKEKLKQMKLITNELRVHASQLSDGLRGVKRDLLVMLTKCNDVACQDVLNKYEIGKLDANGIHYDQLPDVTEIIGSLDRLINENIASAGNRGLNALDAMRAHLNKTIAQYTPQIMSSIKKAGQGLRKASTEIKTELSRVSNGIGNETERHVGIADEFLNEYSPYRFYFGIAVSSVLLLILVCLVVALLCGICGKRPDGYGDDCCNKGSGSRFLMLAVALIFLTISAIALVALVHFLLGIVLYRGVCVPLKNPQNDEIFELLDNSIDLNNVLYPSQSKGKSASGTLPPFRISHVIAACHDNQTLYEVLRIHNRIDMREINDIPAQYKINQTLRNLVDGIDFNNNDIEILSADDKARILQLGESALKNYDSGQFIDNLNDTITKHSLMEIAEQLRSTAKKITTDDDMKDVQVSLRNQALHLESYEQNLVIPMKNQSSELIRLAHELDSIMRYKERSFQEAIPLLVNEIERAQTFINLEGRPFVKATAQNLTRYFASEIERYLQMVVNSVEKKIGMCNPLAGVYDAGIVAGCNRIVDPLNGFWGGVAWCVLLFLPTLIVAVKLSSLYQKSDPYPGPLVESEYLYDAYSERDHIPLANGPKNKRRKKDRRRREYYEEPMATTAHVVAAPTAAVRDTRYNDMAPKHWDGGPPRYQNPPMAPPASEYERPPPYYYPGATEQD